MAKRLSDKQKAEIIRNFTFGESVDFLSQKFDCTKLTIIRNLKKSLGEIKYKKLIIKNKNLKAEDIDIKRTSNFDQDSEYNNKISSSQIDAFEESESDQNSEELFTISPFVEITPLDHEIETSPRKDLSSLPLSDVEFPSIVYMIVDKKIELQTKPLKDYPQWSFLSFDDLNRKTIEIFFDLKIAKRFCNKEQKVIKVPNTNVFKIVAPILIERGITRIVSPEQLISL